MEGDNELAIFLKAHELSINLDDLKFVIGYFRDDEKRDPTLAEMLLIDTYWSDHCRHTTFNTILEEIKVQGEA